MTVIVVTMLTCECMRPLCTHCTRGGVTCHVLQCYTQVWQQHPHVTIASVTLQLESRCNIQQPGSNQFNLCFYPLVEAELILFFNGTDKARSVLLHISQPHSPFVDCLCSGGWAVRGVTLLICVRCNGATAGAPQLFCKQPARAHTSCEGLYRYIFEFDIVSNDFD